ncbi:MAG TPA: hypothetical protein IAC12_08085 [Candidatus Aphodovivens avistercoris]|nr:hypothetical protein [Candidatus Aphodovivens avistercoris]
MRFLIGNTSGMQDFRVEAANVELVDFDGGELVCQLKETLHEVDLPQDVSIRDLLQVDTQNKAEVIAFVERYGLTTSISRGMYIAKLFNAESNLRFPRYLMDSFDEAFPDERDACEYSHLVYWKFMLRGFEEVERIRKYADIASMKEIQIVIENAQNIVKATSKVKLSDENTRFTEYVASERDKELSRAFVRVLAEITNELFPRVGIVEDDEDPLQIPVLHNAMDGIYIRHVLSLADPESYKICANPDCVMKVFQYKGNGRRTNSDYCSEECQKAAKRAREKERRKLKRKAEGDTRV